MVSLDAALLAEPVCRFAIGLIVFGGLLLEYQTLERMLNQKKPHISAGLVVFHL